MATNILYNARVREEQAKGNKRGLARLYGGRAKYASRWKMVKPTELAYQLSDEFYRYSARRDLGLAPTKRQGAATPMCGMRTRRCSRWLTRTALRVQQRLRQDAS